MTSNYDIDIRENMDLINALNKYQKDEKMGDKTYKGKEALLALVRGMKLKHPHWISNDHIKMNLDGQIYNECGSPYHFDENLEYIEYKEPKQKHTYYRAYYRLEDLHNKTIWSTGWAFSEKEMLDFVGSSREIVEIETREF